MRSDSRVELCLGNCGNDFVAYASPRGCIRHQAGQSDRQSGEHIESAADHSLEKGCLLSWSLSPFIVCPSNQDVDWRG